jgi:hypothetical protein
VAPFTRAQYHLPFIQSVMSHTDSDPQHGSPKKIPKSLSSSVGDVIITFDSLKSGSKKREKTSREVKKIYGN